jgi:hypothetical protein
MVQNERLEILMKKILDSDYKYYRGFKSVSDTSYIVVQNMI